jgi:hypothetical protein
MAKEVGLVRCSADELATMKNETDWARVDAMTQEGAERMADEGGGPLPEGREKTIVLGVPGSKRD